MERDLLAAKIAIPRTSPDLLQRSHLTDRLEKAADREFVLVSTPAGFGKTTLLASWARSAKRRFAWLSLDQDDNDPARFWRYVIAAVERVRPGIGKQALSLLNSSAQPTPQAVVMALLNELEAQPLDFILILDDYQVIKSPEVHNSLAFLLEHLPLGMHVMLSSRSDPAFPLARFRARGQLAELHAADFRFSLEEAAVFLHRVLEFNLPKENVVALEERTEGWITGLQLAALALKGASDPAKFVQEFTGSHRYILDYLTEEVLEQQPGDVRSFLLETSILEQLSGPLCDALTGRCNGQEMLEALEQANLFLVPLDEQRRWYRYHHLFADMLLTRLQVAHPERVVELHRKAASWFETEGLISSALRHGIAAGEAAWAVMVVEQNVEELLSRGEGETLRGWLAALPPEIENSRPRLALVQAIAAFNAGHLQTAESFLADAEKAYAIHPNEPYEPSLGKELSMLMNVPASIALLQASVAAFRGDAERAAELIQSAQSHLAVDDRGPRISGRWNLGQADWMLGRLGEAERTFGEIVVEGREARHPHLVMTASAMLGRIQRAQGQLEASLRTYQASLEFAAQTSPNLILSTAVAHVGMAEVYYERDQVEQALRHAEEGIALSSQLISTQYLADSLVILAWIRQAMGDPNGARVTMEEAYRVMPNPAIVALYNPVPAERARLLLLQVGAREIARWVEERKLAAEVEPNYARELEYLVFARYLLKRNMPDQALSLLEHLGTAAKAQARIGSLIQIQAIQSIGYQAVGKEDQAMAVLAQALMQAEPEGYIRTFVDEGQPMAAVLHRALSRGITADYTARLLAAFPSVDRAAKISAQQAAGTLIEPLSKRELEVLRLLASGATNQEIAEELSIALTTARKHVSNILIKLGVHNRMQAVSRGRDLGLI